jgi:hexosaminidase
MKKNFPNNSTDYALLEAMYEARLISIVEKLGYNYFIWQDVFDNGVRVKNSTVINVWKYEKE